jgi:hypothetical protein
LETDEYDLDHSEANWKRSLMRLEEHGEHPYEDPDDEECPQGIRVWAEYESGKVSALVPTASESCEKCLTDKQHFKIVIIDATKKQRPAKKAVRATLIIDGKYIATELVWSETTRHTRSRQWI